MYQVPEIKEFWEALFVKEGLTHKLNFVWGRYFMELLEFVG